MRYFFYLIALEFNMCWKILDSVSSKFKNSESIPTTSAAIKNIECVPESNFEAIYQKTCEYFIFLTYDRTVHFKTRQQR